MRTPNPIPFLAAAAGVCAVLAALEAPATPTPEAKASGTLAISGNPAASLRIGDIGTAANVSFSTKLTFGHDILTIAGVPNSFALAERPQYSLPVYSRPKKPEEVTVILTTEDGRKWKAEWKEVQP